MSIHHDHVDEQNQQNCPVVHVISDSLGDTATEVVNAAAAQFPSKSVRVSRLAKVSDIKQVCDYFDSCAHLDVPCAVFHTIVNPELRDQVRRELRDREIPSIDLLGPAITVLSTLTGEEPHNIPGALHKTDHHYFRRVEGMEFFVEHDNGRNLQDLSQADAVLVGPARASKTPLSMYLAFLGYKVANLLLDAEHQAPEELKQLDPRVIFGLISDTQDLAEIRKDQQNQAWANKESSLSSGTVSATEIAREEQATLDYMRDLGCTIIYTKGRAVEEMAAEIIETIKAGAQSSRQPSDSLS